MSSAGNFLSEVINHTIRNIRTNIVPNLEEENNEAWKTFKMMDQLQEELRKYTVSTKKPGNVCTSCL